MNDPQAPPPGTKGTVVYVDDIGQIGMKWDTGSGLSLIPGEIPLKRFPLRKQRKQNTLSQESGERAVN